MDKSNRKRRGWPWLLLGALPLVVIAAGAVIVAAQDWTPIAPDGTARRDLGIGETLLLVVGGSYATRAEAEQAASALRIGEIQGFYVDAKANYRVVGAEAALPDGEWLTLSAFRTAQGAREFASLADAAGASNVTTVQAVKLGGGFVGLGQEADPSGRGPLLRPLPDQPSYQK